MTKNDFEKLVNSVKSSTGWDEKEIAVDMGYNEGYISQVRTRGIFPAKFIKNLQSYLPKDVTNIETIKGDIAVLQTSVDVLIREMAKMKRDLYKDKDAIIYRNELFEEIKLNESGKQLLSE